MSLSHVVCGCIVLLLYIGDENHFTTRYCFASKLHVFFLVLRHTGWKNSIRVIEFLTKQLHFTSASHFKAIIWVSLPLASLRLRVKTIIKHHVIQINHGILNYWQEYYVKGKATVCGEKHIPGESLAVHEVS